MITDERFPEGTACAINNQGTAVGYFHSTSGMPHAFLWSAEAGVQLISQATHYGSYAFDINEAGSILGATYSAGYDPRFVVWGSDGAVFPVGTGDPSDYGKQGAINNLGTVAINCCTGNEVCFPILLRGNETQRIVSDDPEDLHVNAINNLNDSVGSSIRIAHGQRPFVWFAREQKLELIDVPTGYALGINDKCEIVGQSSPHAFYWSKSEGLVMLPHLGSERAMAEARAINARGHMVGCCYTSGGRIADAIKDSGGVMPLPGFLVRKEVVHAVLWYGNREVLDLNALIPAEPRYELIVAHDINDLNQIVGEGLCEGRRFAFVLTPED